MKRNALKVKCDRRTENIFQSRIQEDEYLSTYLSDFPDLVKTTSVRNNHAEVILCDQSLQVYVMNSQNRIFNFHPFSDFIIKTNFIPRDSQLDVSTRLLDFKNSNIHLYYPGGENYPLGFIGELSLGGFDFRTILLCDISHRYNSFGDDIFRQISAILREVWGEIPDDFEVKCYERQQLSFGMDAEFELIKNKQIIRAGDYFPFEGEIGTDGHPATLELRPHQENTSTPLLENLTQLMQEVYNKRFEIDTEGNEEALGTHIHFGIEFNQIFIDLLDCWISKPLWHLNGSARGGYKHLSEARITDLHYGFEYRSLPSGILKDKSLASIVLKVIEGLAIDFYIGNKEISLHPCKEDYLQYIDESEWKKWRVYKKDDDKRFNAESWGCHRKGSLYQRNIPGSLELDIPIQVYLYKLRADRGNVFYLSPISYTVRDYFLDSFEKTFRVVNETVEAIRSVPSDFYLIGMPYEMHSNPSIYNEWLGNFITFLNSSSLEEIPEL